MAKPARKEVVRALLERSGRTYAEQLRINVESNRPSELFRLLCASLLFGARISADIAVAATTALRKQGWTTAAKMADATWAQWEELVPFADRRALKSAERLGLPADTKGLAKLVDRHDFARLIAALVRTELAGDHDAMRRLAAGKADQD